MKQRLTMLFIMLLLVLATSLSATDEVLKSTKDIKEILRKVSPSIVKVVSENHKLYFASGVAVAKDMVISNRNVIPGRYDRIYVTTTSGKNYKAQVIGKDMESSMILLKLEEKVLKPIRWAENAEVGDWVALVGAFYSQFPSINQGIVSTIADDHMLLNAPVAPGGSGAAVVNRRGELVGVVRGSFGFTVSPDYHYVGADAEVVVESTRNRQRHLCFALPVDRVGDIYDDLKTFGRVRRAWLGVFMDMRENQVIISDIVPQSPAFAAGILKGDVLVEIAEAPINNAKDIARVLRTIKPEQKIKINVLRNNAVKSLQLIAGDAVNRQRTVSTGHVWSTESGNKFNINLHQDPDEVMEIEEGPPRLESYVFRFIGSRTLGVDTVSLNPELAREFNVAGGKGLMVSKLYNGSAAEKSGIRVADVIVKINSTAIESTKDLRLALNRLKDEEAAEVHLVRKGKQLKLKVQPDNTARVNTFFDRFDDKLGQIMIRVDEENMERVNASGRNQGVGSVRNVGSEPGVRTNRKPATPVTEKSEGAQLEAYKQALEQMRKEQERLKKEMLEMKKRMEAKEKEAKEKEDREKAEKEKAEKEDKKK